jgi:hypothetical protein
MYKVKSYITFLLTCSTGIEKSGGWHVIEVTPYTPIATFHFKTIHPIAFWIIRTVVNPKTIIIYSSSISTISFGIKGQQVEHELKICKQFTWKPRFQLLTMSHFYVDYVQQRRNSLDNWVTVYVWMTASQNSNKNNNIKKLYDLK